MELEIQRDESAGTALAECDWTEVEPSRAVVELASSLLGRPVTELTPLYSAVDPDAIDTLLDASRPTPITLSFTYEGLEVSLSGDGVARVSRIHEAVAPASGLGTS